MQLFKVMCYLTYTGMIVAILCCPDDLPRLWDKIEIKFGPGPEIIKLFFVLSSVEHEILNAHKYQNISRKSALFRHR